MISALSTVAISPEKDIDWTTTILTSNNSSVDSVNFESEDNVELDVDEDNVDLDVDEDNVKLDVDENVNKIPHSAVPRLLSW